MTNSIARYAAPACEKTAPQPDDPGKADLSERGAEVIDLLARGYPSQEIAMKMAVTCHTVHARVRDVFEKPHVRSRAQAPAVYTRRS